MANAYREIFKAKNALGFSLSGLIARMPMSMISIALIAMLNQLGASYATASYVAAAYVVSCAIFAPYLSRLADRYGQSRLIIIGTSITTLCLTSLVFAAYKDAPLPLMIILAVGCGFLPSFGAFVRARWSMIYARSPKLRTAFALESIFDEIIYIVGPVIALFCTTTITPIAGPLSALIFLIVGSLAFLQQKSTEPKPQKLHHNDRSSVLRIPQIQLLALTLLSLGTIYGALEVAVLAFAQEQQQPAFASAPIAAYALGSLISGVLYGTKHWHFPLPKQLFIMVILAAIATIPVCLVTTLWQLSFVLFCAGAACSPTIIISMSLVESIVPRHKLTEGMAWTSTGMTIGTSIGAAFSGPLIDQYGAISGFYVAVSAVLFALLMGIISVKGLTHKEIESQ